MDTLLGERIDKASPSICDQRPVPIVGVLPINVIGSKVQYEVAVPVAVAVVGGNELVTVTSSYEEQGPKVVEVV